MFQVETLISTDLISEDGQLWMTSRQLAEVFGKRHNNVLHDIESMLKIGAFSSDKVVSSKYQVEGQLRSYKQYVLHVDCYNDMASRYASSHRIAYGAREKAALDTIEQVLGVRLTRQYMVLGYRIDGYDEENRIAYEIDEQQHAIPSHRASDQDRQKAISSFLGCTFKRIKLY